MSGSESRSSLAMVVLTDEPREVMFIGAALARAARALMRVKIVSIVLMICSGKLVWLGVL